MLFNSIHFILFFPIVTLLYFVLPLKYRWVWLLAASYYFYMSWNPVYLLLIMLSTFITYASALLIEKSGQDKWKKKLWLVLCLVSNLGILFYFKYFNFMVANLNRVLQIWSLPVSIRYATVLLPIGISFYTFQALSYTIDVYRGDTYAEKNLGKYALFVSFFPQLVAGPIERSKNLLRQINVPTRFHYNHAKNGFLLMLWGFFQKLVIADRAAILVNEVFNNYQRYEGVEILVAVLMFAIQIYCDFAGYSNIAIGAAKVLGFDLMNNFDAPYLSRSIKEFWRRWHISLSTWFKDYLYIPLGGNRKGKLITMRNIMVVFVLSGLWHGASWNFIIWGGLHGFYQITGMVLLPFRQKVLARLKINTGTDSYRLFQTLFTFALVNFAWIFFRASGLRAALSIIKRLLRFNPWALFDGALFQLGLDGKDFMLLLTAIIFLFVISWLHQRISIREWLAGQNIIFRWFVYYAVIFTVLIFGIYGPGYDATEFIYFQF